MENKFIYFFLIFLFSLGSYSSEIIYDKNNILITKQDIAQYKLIEKEFNYLNDNSIIKEIVLIKRTIDNLKINNPKYYEQNINYIKSKDFYIDKVDQSFLEQYLFYINVRNDIAKEFMLNKFERDKIKIIFKDKSITFGLSKNKCMTIYKTLPIEDLNNDEIYNILDRKIINFQFQKVLDNNMIDVCLSKNINNQLIQIFNNYMINNSKEDFLKFTYEKK